MKQLFFALVTITILLASCKKKDVTNILITKYKGTFQRQVAGAGPIANVTIDFDVSTWSGQGDAPKYPALCNGSYKFKGTDTISFENHCVWTAEFDWTLILSGDYKIISNDSTLEFSKDYNGAYKDIYKLKMQ